MNNDLIKELNKFLTGIHMGAATFKDYRDKAQNEELKAELENIISSFKTHEEAITHRIEALGGVPSDSIGILGEAAEFWERIKLISVDSDVEVCEHAMKAMNMGIKGGTKFITEHSDIDESIMNDVKGVVADYDNHLAKIEELSHKFR